MHMILRYPSGRLVDGILLAAGPGRMRIAVRRRNETIELSLKEGHWTGENGDRIELEGLIAGDTSGLAEFFSGMTRQVSTATH